MVFLLLLTALRIAALPKAAMNRYEEGGIKKNGAVIGFKGRYAIAPENAYEESAE